LDIQKTVLEDESHEDIASSHVNMGLSYYATGRYETAIESYQSAIVIQEKIHGTDHSITGTSYNNIGTANYKYHDYDHALEFYMKALDIKVNAVGADNPAMYSQYSNIGAAHWKIGNKKEAVFWFQKACDVDRERFYRDHYRSSSRKLLRYMKHTPHDHGDEMEWCDHSWMDDTSSKKSGYSSTVNFSVALDLGSSMMNNFHLEHDSQDGDVSSIDNISITDSRSKQVKKRGLSKERIREIVVPSGDIVPRPPDREAVTPKRNNTRASILSRTSQNGTNVDDSNYHRMEFTRFKHADQEVAAESRPMSFVENRKVSDKDAGSESTPLLLSNNGKEYLGKTYTPLVKESKSDEQFQIEGGDRNNTDQISQLNTDGESFGEKDASLSAELIVSGERGIYDSKPNDIISLMGLDNRKHLDREDSSSRELIGMHQADTNRADHHDMDSAFRVLKDNGAQKDTPSTTKKRFVQVEKFDKNDTYGAYGGKSFDQLKFDQEKATEEELAPRDMRIGTQHGIGASNILKNNDNGYSFRVGSPSSEEKARINNESINHIEQHTVNMFVELKNDEQKSLREQPSNESSNSYTDPDIDPKGTRLEIASSDDELMDTNIIDIENYAAHPFVSLNKGGDKAMREQPSKKPSNSNTDNIHDIDTKDTKLEIGDSDINVMDANIIDIAEEHTAYPFVSLNKRGDKATREQSSNESSNSYTDNIHNIDIEDTRHEIVGSDVNVMDTNIIDIEEHTAHPFLGLNKDKDEAMREQPLNESSSNSVTDNLNHIERKGTRLEEGGSEVEAMKEQPSKESSDSVTDNLNHIDAKGARLEKVGSDEELMDANIIAIEQQRSNSVTDNMNDIDPKGVRLEKDGSDEELADANTIDMKQYAAHPYVSLNKGGDIAMREQPSKESSYLVTDNVNGIDPKGIEKIGSDEELVDANIIVDFEQHIAYLSVSLHKDGDKSLREQPPNKSSNSGTGKINEFDPKGIEKVGRDVDVMNSNIIDIEQYTGYPFVGLNKDKKQLPREPPSKVSSNSVTDNINDMDPICLKKAGSDDEPIDANIFDIEQDTLHSFVRLNKNGDNSLREQPSNESDISCTNHINDIGPKGTRLEKDGSDVDFTDVNEQHAARHLASLNKDEDKSLREQPSKESSDSVTENINDINPIDIEKVGSDEEVIDANINDTEQHTSHPFISSNKDRDKSLREKTSNESSNSVTDNVNHIERNGTSIEKGCSDKELLIANFNDAGYPFVGLNKDEKHLLREQPSNELSNSVTANIDDIYPLGTKLNVKVAGINTGKFITGKLHSHKRQALLKNEGMEKTNTGVGPLVKLESDRAQVDLQIETSTGESNRNIQWNDKVQYFSDMNALLPDTNIQTVSRDKLSSKETHVNFEKRHSESQFFTVQNEDSKSSSDHMQENVVAGRFNQKECIGSSGETSDYDAVVSLATNGLPVGSDRDMAKVSSSNVQQNVVAGRFNQKEYIGSSGGTSDYDAVVSLATNGLPVGSGGDAAKALSIVAEDDVVAGRFNQRSSSKTFRVPRGHYFSHTERKVHGPNHLSFEHRSDKLRINYHNDHLSFVPSTNKSSTPSRVPLPEVFVRLYNIPKKEVPSTEIRKELSKAGLSFTKTKYDAMHSSSIPSHRVKLNNRNIQGDSRNENRALVDHHPFKYKGVSSHYSRFVPRRQTSSPSKRWRSKIDVVTRKRVPSSERVMTLSIFDRLYQHSRLSDPNRKIKRSILPRKSKSQRIYGYDRTKKNHSRPRRIFHVPAVFLQLYERSLQRRIEGRRRRLLIECELKRREAERKGELICSHTDSCLKLRLHKQRRDQSRAYLENELAKSRKRISISQADALYERLLIHKRRTDEKIEEIRRTRGERKVKCIFFLRHVGVKWMGE
jgi:FOG: TPR repeat